MELEGSGERCYGKGQEDEREMEVSTHTEHARALTTLPTWQCPRLPCMAPADHLCRMHPFMTFMSVHRMERWSP